MRHLEHRRHPLHPSLRLPPVWAGGVDARALRPDQARQLLVPGQALVGGVGRRQRYRHAHAHGGPGRENHGGGNASARVGQALPGERPLQGSARRSGSAQGMERHAQAQGRGQHGPVAPPLVVGHGPLRVPRSGRTEGNYSKDQSGPAAVRGVAGRVQRARLLQERHHRHRGHPDGISEARHACHFTAGGGDASKVRREVDREGGLRGVLYLHGARALLA
mmetsp:Transcript_4191/g.10060  ORF Transcript_4191/g.10060 Transcript_4191/m.10060 type:complete len:220 (+) Transcript_4191:1298-1957(+)